MEVKIGIVLLNYNTSSDVICATEFIKLYTHIPYEICVVDNDSNKEEKEKLSTLHEDYVHVVYREVNDGYAKGNNAGIEYLMAHYKPKYLLIMNPDVSVIEDFTIDHLVNKLESFKDDKVCGIQPLVWTPRLGDDPRVQVNIRAVKSYWDCCINSFHLLGAIFQKRANRLIYKNEMPYEKDLLFEVPSGCFFIVDANLFRKIGYFDKRTFLYNEEYIIGYKFKELGYNFYLYTGHKVQHEQGVSTGANRKKVSFRLTRFEIASLNVYLKYYLNAGHAKVIFVDFLVYINYIGRYLKYNLMK